MATHELAVERNAEGATLAYLSPIENGEVESGCRIAGPKAWGGSTNLATLEISDEDLARYIRQYASGVIDLLSESA